MKETWFIISDIKVIACRFTITDVYLSSQSRSSHKAIYLITRQLRLSPLWSVAWVWPTEMRKNAATKVNLSGNGEYWIHEWWIPLKNWFQLHCFVSLAYQQSAFINLIRFDKPDFGEFTRIEGRIKRLFTKASRLATKKSVVSYFSCLKHLQWSSSSALQNTAVHSPG